MLGFYSYDLLRNVLVTWPSGAPFVEWLCGLVHSFRQVKLARKTRKRLFTQLRLLSSLRFSELGDDAPCSHRPSVLRLGTADPTHSISNSVGQMHHVQGRHISKVSLANRRRSKVLLTDWRFQKGGSGSDETHQIEVRVGGLGWVTEEEAHRKYRPQLLSFWDSQGGREKVIVEHGGTVTENTKFLIHEILRESLDGSAFYVEWVGYGNGHRSWVMKGEISEKLIRAFRRKRLRG